MSLEDRDQRDPLQSLIAEILEAEGRGESVDREALIQTNPDHADSLREFFASHDQIKSAANVDAPTLQPRAAELASEDPTIAPGPGPIDDPTLPPTTSKIDDPTIPPTAGASKTDEPTVGDQVRYFGDYELLEEIARGGMGVVFKARQMNLNRIVALKMILAGQFAGEEDVQRFYTEAEAAAALDHPGIVPIFEIGEHAGQHYFSMGYIEGESLAHRVIDGPLPPREAADLVKQICDAMAYAHERGVVHRDLKPANILIDANGQPKVTDFGLAKKTESDSNLTGTGQILGTPAYMPPEQASGNMDEVGPISDIYSLGAILYCLLTGRPPFQAASPMDTLLQVLEKEPIPPRQLDSSIPIDLETICLTCLSKESKKRYGSATAVSDELARFLKGEPIHARPVGRLERGWRWCKRNPAIASLSGLAAALLLLGSVVSTYFAIEASREGAIAAEKAAEAVAQGRIAEERAAEALAAKTQAEQERDRAEYQLYGNFIKLAQQELNQNNIPQVDRYLEACPQRMRNFEWYYLRQAAHGYASQFEEQSLALSSLAVSPDGKLSAIGGADRTIQLWKTATGELVRTLRGHRGSVAGLAFSPDGKRLASASWDRTVRVWDVDSGRSLHTYTRHSDQVHCVAFSADGKWIGSGGRDKSLQLWDAEDYTPVHVLREHEGVVSAIAFEPGDGALIASGSSDGTLRIWNVETGKQERVLKGHTHFVNSVDFSPDGKLIASSCLDNPVYIWDANSGEKLKELGPDSKNSASIRFSLNGNRLATCNNDGRIRIWLFSLHPRAKLTELFSIPGHHDGSCQLEFDPSLGSRLVSAGRDGIARVWDLTRPPSFIPLEAAVGHESVAFDFTGQNLLVADSESPFSNSWEKDRVCDLSIHSLQDLKQSTTLGTFRGWITTLAAGEGGLIAVGSTESEQKHSRLTVFRLGEPRPVIEQLELPGVVTRLKFSSDGGKLVSAILRPDREHEVWLWDTTRGESVLRMLGHRGTGSMTDISPDGARILSGYFLSGRERMVSMWDATNGTSLVELKTHALIVITRFSPDGRHIAVAGIENRDDGKRVEHTIKIINADSGEVERTFEGHGDAIRAVAYSPDGSRLASKDNDGVIKIWDLQTGQEMLSLKSKDLTSLLTFSADGRRLLSSGGTNTRIWEGNDESTAVMTQKQSYPLLELAKLDVKTTRATTPPIVKNPIGSKLTFAGKPESYWLQLLRRPPEQLDWQQRRPLEDGGRDAMPIVMQALKSDDSNMRQNALQVLQFSSPKNEYRLQEEELAAVRRLIDDDNVLTRVSAIQTLWFWTRKSGGAPIGIDQLIELSSSNDPMIAGRALYGLSQMLSAAFPTTKTALESDDDQVRAAMGEALRSLADPYLHMRAGFQLELDGRAPELVPILAEAIRRKDPALADVSISILGAIGPDAGPAVPALIPLLDETDPDTFYRTVQGLTRIGKPAAVAVPRLITLAESQQPTIRWALAKALQTIEPGTHDDLIAKLVADQPAAENEAGDQLRITGLEYPRFGALGLNESLTVFYSCTFKSGRRCNIKAELLNEGIPVRFGYDGLRSPRPGTIELKSRVTRLDSEPIDSLQLRLMVDGEQQKPALTLTLPLAIPAITESGG